MLGIYNILAQRYNLQPDQKVLIVYDEKKKAIARGFISTSREIGASVKAIKLGEKRFEGGKMAEITSTVKKGRFDLFLNLLEAKVEETDYRIKLTKLEMASGGSVGHGPGITQSMVHVKVDYDELMSKAKNLKKLLKGSTHVKISSKLGTNLKVAIKGRKFLDDIMRSSRLANIPCGEIWCAPIENKADGVLIADASASSMGLLPQPLVIDVAGGKIKGMRWLRHPGKNRVKLATARKAFSLDEGASTIAEFGIGLVPYDISGNMLQDEKAAGTIHIAFGDNTFYGGRNSSQTHIDLLVRAPTVTAYYPSKKAKTFLRGGKLLL